MRHLGSLRRSTGQCASATTACVSSALCLALLTSSGTACERTPQAALTTPPPPAAPPPPATAASLATPAPGDSAAPSPAGWPDSLSAALAGRGDPHAQPIALPPDARGRTRYLAFVGTRDFAVGAFHVTLAPPAPPELDPVERWPTGVRVLGGVVEEGVAYVLLESGAVLDQPSGLRGVWIDADGPPSPFEASPMALHDVRDPTELAARVKRPPVDRDPQGLASALRTAAASPAALAASLPADGADVLVAWQSLFTQRIGQVHADDAATSPLAGAVLTVLRDAIATQACGADTCEAWTEGGRAVVRFVRGGGRWLVRSVIEEAPATRPTGGVSGPHLVSASTEAGETESLLRARARSVGKILGQAPLSEGGGTIGVALTDLVPDVPIIAVREGASARVFAVDAGPAWSDAGQADWEAAFADLDGDGRTDVVLRMSVSGDAGPTALWTQGYLAPAPSVQVAGLEPDLASALAVMDARDVGSAARAATSIPLRRLAHDDVCRLLAAAATPDGFRREASPDARLIHFDQPNMPTWRAKIVPLAKLAIDDVHGLGGHCRELACNPTRPYCAWTGGAASEHFWFTVREGRLQIAGAADYDGE